MPEEALELVPPPLFAGRKLDRKLPRPAAAQLHVVLKLANGPDDLLKEFHDIIPQINDVLEFWSETRRADPTSIGEAKLRARASIPEDPEKGKASIFNLVSSLDKPGRSGIIYLTDDTEQDRTHAEDASIPSNLDWLGFEGSHVHIHAEPKKTASPEEQHSNSDEHSMRRNSTPFNLRITEWPNDVQYTDISNYTCSPEPQIDERNPSSKTRSDHSFRNNFTNPKWR